MPDFEQLNFRVEAQDNATKTLNEILKVLTKLEKKMNGLSKFKMPNIGLTNEQVKLLNNWDKLDKKLQKVEQDLKSVTKVQKQLEKFEIVPKGKPLFTYDAATQSYIDNNLGVARREAEKLKKELERQGIQDIIKGWGKGQLSLPAPPEYTAYRRLINTSTVENITGDQAEVMIRDLEIYNDEVEVLKEIDELLKRINKNKKQKIVLDYPNYDEVREWHQNLNNERRGLFWSELGIKADLYKRRTTYSDDGIAETTSIYKQQIKDLEYTYEVVDDKVKKITAQTKKATKEASKLQKAFKGVQKFLKSIGKIVLYRAIRSAMAEIKKAIQTSQEDLAKFDSDYNQTMSKLVASLDILKASMGLIIRPFVEVLEPTIGNIVDVFAQIGNYISYATSKSKGLSTYTKINAEYAKDYLESLQQANNLLSFDKFEVLQKQETKDIYEEARVSDGIDASKNIQDIGDFIINGASTLKSALNTLEIIEDLLAPLRLLAPLANLSEIIDGIANLLESFTTGWNKEDVIKSLAQVFNGAIGNPITNLLETIINLVINSWNKSLDMWNDVIGFIGKIFNKEWKLNWYLDDVDLGKWDTVDKPDVKMPNSDGILGNANQYASKRILGEDLANVRTSLDNQFASKAVVEFDFKNVNNNSIARELAVPLANQLKKQNINVKFS